MNKTLRALVIAVSGSSLVQAMQKEMPVSGFAAAKQRIETALNQAIIEQKNSTLYSEGNPELSADKELLPASAQLLDRTSPLPLEQHPLYAPVMSHTTFSRELKTGPTIDNVTSLLLAHAQGDLLSLDFAYYDNAETFVRAFDIFKKKFI